MDLRPYQQKAIDLLYAWFENNPTGHPVVCLPGGSGKSVVIASVVKDAMQNWPETRVLMLVGVKELIQQNYNKLRELWRNAPVGIYSASLRQKCLTEPITYGGIQSLAKRAKDIGHIDLCIIDEVHAVSNEETGNYRKLLAELLEINPSMRIIGYTASPYRLGQGMITEGDNAIFTEIIEPVTIEELVHEGYLCKLRSKHTALTLDVTGVKKAGGEYIASQLEAAVDTSANNVAVVSEIIARGHDCRSWLVFCTGINHAAHITELLVHHGIDAKCLTGKTPAAERDRIIDDFKSDRLRCMVGVGIFTTGFDHVGVDLIVMLRPTASPGLYLQSAVRGSRPAYAPNMPLETRDQRWAAMHAGRKPDGCLVLDFAGNVALHGPIVAIAPPEAKKGKKGDTLPPTKTCPNCQEIVGASARTCTACGHQWPVDDTPKPAPSLRNDDIMGVEASELPVKGWRWRKHISRASGQEMLAVTYYGRDLVSDVTEYLPIKHEGYAGAKSRRLLADVMRQASPNELFATEDNLEALSQALNQGQPPALVMYRKDGKFYRVEDRKW
jgi:DNA repair protein RadD